MDWIFPGGFSGWRNVSLGAITFGIVIMVWHLGRWKATNPKGAWKNKDSLSKLLVPFFPLWLFGNLLILCANGLIGWVVGAALWLGDFSGKHALRDGVGAGAPGMTRIAGTTLTDPGYMVVLAVVAFVTAWGIHKGVFKGKGRWNLVLPIMSGICMGLSQGVAGSMGHATGAAADTLGSLIVGWI